VFDVKKLKITVLMGGDSPEREISLQTGEAVAMGLSAKGHEVTKVDIPSVAAVMQMTELKDQDVVFPALHGGEGEDGHLQSLLDLMGVRYALSGATASAIAMDKCASKRLMRGAGIPTPDWLQVSWDRVKHRADSLKSRQGLEISAQMLTVARIRERAASELGFPLVVKLNGAGSSVGIAIVENEEDFDRALDDITAGDDGPKQDIIIEKYIPGRELTVALFLGRRLPLLEIRTKDGFYDYQNKYTAGANEYLVPAPVHSPLYEQIAADALRVYDLVGCRGTARVDFRLDGEQFYCLEINTIPGMTANSLVPKAAASVGIEFEELVEDLCLAALPQDA
jgi:D-alanine-D-alanine ligase